MASADTRTEPQLKIKRPVCPSCTKPGSLCICSRIATLGLDNKVSVSVLQHKLETKHALNSVRIAKLGLKYLTLVTVCDVNYEARFVIKLLQVGVENGAKSCDFDQVTQKPVFEDGDGFNFGKKEICSFGFSKVCSLFDDDTGDCDGLKNSNFDQVSVVEETPKPVSENVRKGELEFVEGSNLIDTSLGNDCRKMQNTKHNLGFDQDKFVFNVKGEPLISATVSKYGLNSDFDRILGCEDAVQALAEGFVVRKIQREQICWNNSVQEHQEFEIEVPAGSVLLFPSDKSVTVDELKAMNFDVKNLIVLDGTWAKANRMYKENPWLKLLPHLRLDLDKTSLYSEVRRQPRPGCLSTIESIVYALKAVGDDPDCGLDNLLDAFESMVEDQRRYSNESLGRYPD